MLTMLLNPPPPCASVAVGHGILGVSNNAMYAANAVNETPAAGNSAVICFRA